MRRKITHFTALVLAAASMLAPASGVTRTRTPAGPKNAPQTQEESDARLRLTTMRGVAAEDLAAGASVLVAQNTAEPMRWPEYPREPVISPATSRRPTSTLSRGSYGRSPGDGTAPSFKRWPQAGRVYAPPYNASPPEPVRWPEYRH